jgi:hypothetical protein
MYVEVWASKPMLAEISGGCGIRSIDCIKEESGKK